MKYGPKVISGMRGDLCLSLLRRKPVTSTGCAGGSEITYTPRLRKACKYVNSSAVNSSARWVTGKSASGDLALGEGTRHDPEINSKLIIMPMALRPCHIVQFAEISNSLFHSISNGRHAVNPLCSGFNNAGDGSCSSCAARQSRVWRICFNGQLLAMVKHVRQ